MEIFFEGKNLNISNSIWEKYEKIHQDKSKKAIHHVLDVLKYEKPNFTAADVETLIENESVLSQNLPSIIEKARGIYEKQNRID